MRAFLARKPPVNTPQAASSRLPLLVVLSLFCVYVIWGSTYLAMRFVVAELPPPAK